MKIEMLGEFGYDITLGAPFAYHQYINGVEFETINVKDTKPFYFFSEKHKELDMKRDMCYEMKVDGKYRVKRHNHSVGLHWKTLSHDKNLHEDLDHLPDKLFWHDQWTPPPYSAYYKNNFFRFEKPLYIISNKYQSEWDGGPVNFIDLETLDKIFEMLSPNFKVIYNRPKPSNIVEDHSTLMDFGDFDLIGNIYKGRVTLIQDLQGMAPQLSFNELQMYLYANCSNFISVQGGNSVLCSYFGGKNIVYAVKGMEVKWSVYETYFPLFSCAQMVHAKSYEEVIESVKEDLQ